MPFFFSHKSNWKKYVPNYTAAIKRWQVWILAYLLSLKTNRTFCKICTYKCMWHAKQNDLWRFLTSSCWLTSTIPIFYHCRIHIHRRCNCSTVIATATAADADTNLDDAIFLGAAKKQKKKNTELAKRKKKLQQMLQHSHSMKKTEKMTESQHNCTQENCCHQLSVVIVG